MSRLYLITGFLGAGKTTFLKKLLLHFAGQKLRVIVNEFGKEGIDGTLLEDLGAALDEINNGSIFCSCRLDKFEEVLENALEENPDVIIVEASGLSDPTNVRKILEDTDKGQEIDYRGCICLVDALQFPKVYETATVVKKQMNVCDMVLINKTDLVSKEQCEAVKKTVQSHCPEIPVYETVYGEVEESWLKTMEVQSREEPDALFQTADITLRRYLLKIRQDTEIKTICSFMKMLLDDTYRMKGFFRCKEEWYYVNSVGNMLYTEPCDAKPEKENLLVVLSGYGRPVKKAIETAMKWYPDVVEAWEK